MKTKYKWVVLGSYMFVAALTQIYWLNFASIETFMESELQLAPGHVMWLTMVFILVVVLVSVPAGIFLDKKGFKNGFGVGTLIITIFASLRLLAPHSFGFLLFCQAGIALGEPFIFNGITKLATLWFDENEEATAVGLGSLALVAGLMISVGLTPHLVDKMGYVSMLVVYAFLGIIAVFIYFFLIKPDPIQHNQKIREILPTNGWNDLKSILKIKNFQILSIISLLGIGVFNGLTTWYEKILHDDLNLSLVQAGNVGALLMLSGMVGCVIIPYLSDKYKTKTYFLIINLIFIIFTLSIMLILPNYISTIANAIVLGFFLLASLPIILTLSADTTGPQYTGIAVGFLQLLGNAGGILLIWVIEILRDYNQNYWLGILLMVLLLLIALILAFRMRRTELI